MMRQFLFLSLTSRFTKKLYAFMILLILLWPQTLLALENLDDSSLSDVSGEGVGFDIEIGQIDLGFFQIIDDDGADLGDVYDESFVRGRDFGDGVTTGGCDTAGSNCGAFWMTGEMFGNITLEAAAGKATIDVSDAQNGSLLSVVPALFLYTRFDDFQVAFELINGYEVTGPNSGAGGGPGSWGYEFRFTNIVGAELEANVLLYSPRNTDQTLRVAGTGVYFEDLTVLDSFSFDLEYKDQDLTGSDSTDPAQASYYNNRLQIIDISPVGGDVLLAGMTLEVDDVDGMVIDFPVITGSLEFGGEGSVDGGLHFAGVQSARILFDEWNWTPGVLTVNAH